MSVRIRRSPIPTESGFLYFLIKYCLYQSKTIFQKKNFFFQPPVHEIWLTKVFPKSEETFKRLEFQEIISYDAQYIAWFCYVFYIWKCNDKNKKACDLIGAAGDHVSKSQKCNFMAFSYWNMHRCPKDHMAESKYSENLPLVLANLIQIVMRPISHQKI